MAKLELAVQPASSRDSHLPPPAASILAAANTRMNLRAAELPPELPKGRFTSVLRWMVYTLPATITFAL